MKPEILVLSSGGSKGLAHLGALSYYEMKNQLTNIHTFVGCSIGSMICLLLNVGYRASELAELFLYFKLDYQTGLSNIIDDYGFYDMKQLKEKLSKMVMDKLGMVPTLKQLYELTKKRLLISTYNVDRLETYYFDYFNEPDCLVTDAVCISMSIPIFFKAYEYKGYRFVDGAVGDAFGIDVMNDGKTPILGIVLYSDKKSVKSFINYISKLSEGNNKEFIQMKINQLKKNCTILEIECLDPDFFNVNMEERLSVYSQGWVTGIQSEIHYVKEENEIVEKINEICSLPLLTSLSYFVQQKPDVAKKSFSQIPYHQLISLCNISDFCKEVKTLKQIETVTQVKNTIYHHLHRIMSIIIPKHFWSKIPLVKEKNLISK